MSDAGKESSPNRKVALTIRAQPEELLEIFAVRMRVTDPDIETALGRITRFFNKLYEKQEKGDRFEIVKDGRVVWHYRLPS